jgi:RNA polymerase sigma-70 factor (ECF subfamily)
MLNDGDIPPLLEQAQRGDRAALGQLFNGCRDRLRLLVQFRLDRRLLGRIDPSDVVQDAYLEATERFEDYLQNPNMPFFLWLRFLTAQRVLILHRHHLKAKARAADREQPLAVGAFPEATSAALAEHLLAQSSTPSQAAVQAEARAGLQKALESMDAIDREVLVLRHFEQLTNAETAQTLGIQEATASQRYVRALKRLRDILTHLPGGLTGTVP